MGCRVSAAIAAKVRKVVTEVVVETVHDSVAQAIHQDKPADQFMVINMLVKRQVIGDATRAQRCDTFAQHEHKRESAGEVETLAWKEPQLAESN